jgi:hypothetical protein
MHPTGSTRNRTFSSWCSESSETIDAAVPEDLDVHVIVDNHATHKRALIQRWLAKRPRYHLHFTPKGASWINLVERRFALLTENQLRSGVPTHHSRPGGGH